MVFLALVSCFFAVGPSTAAGKDWVVFDGRSGPGKGKSIVLLSGDEEYRSEEGLPQLAKILAFRHGFKCTVLFSINTSGEIDPKTTSNEPGIEAMDSADLCIMLLRFRQWPDSQMSHFVNYYRAGKPIIALRTSTHAFAYAPDSKSPYRNYDWQSKTWSGGFGRQVLGETWISHWGDHGHQATRGVLSEGSVNVVLRGVKDIFGTTDVYEAAPPTDAEVLVRGQVLSGMSPQDAPAVSRKKTSGGAEQDLNNPMMPIAWLRRRSNEDGKQNKILVTTMGAATDLQNPGLRRLLINGAFWAVGLENRISDRLNVDLVGSYSPTSFGFDGFRRGVKPADLEK